MRPTAAVSLVLVLAVMLTLTVRAQETSTPGSRKIVNKVTPFYPELARRMKLEGTVKLQVTVAPNGTAKTVDPIGGNPVLLKAAEDAVHKFRWTPGTQESKELVEIRFHRSGSE